MQCSSNDPDHTASAVLTIAPNDSLTHLFVVPNEAFRTLLRSHDGGRLIAMIVARLIEYREATPGKTSLGLE
jgi:hypothetical protein